MSKKTFAELVLIFTALVWSLTYPLIRIVVSEMSPAVLMFWRGTIAAIIFGIFIFYSKHALSIVLKLLPAGFFLGFFFYIGYITQAIGLQTIESGRSAFITSLYVVFVPILSPIFRGSPPTKHDIISCFIAFSGLALLTDPLSQDGLRVGDLLTLIAALCFSVQIHLIQIYTRKYKNYIVFSFLQAVYIGIFSAICIPFINGSTIVQWLPTSKSGLYSLLYLAVFATATTTWLQTRFQHNTTAERASIIYVLEPVFALIFGYYILNEVVSFVSLFGACMMILAVLWGFMARILTSKF